METVGKQQPVDIFPADIFSVNYYGSQQTDDWPHNERKQFLEKLNFIFEGSKCFESDDDDCFAKEFNLQRRTNRTLRQASYLNKTCLGRFQDCGSGNSNYNV
jgi:hypothetical protein